MVKNNSLFGPKTLIKGFIIIPDPIAAKEPPALIKEKIRLACLALNISPVRTQN